MKSKEDTDIENISESVEKLSISKYECKHCGVMYKVLWTLKAHVLKKHEINEEETQVPDLDHDLQFRCENCVKTFKCKDELNKHLLSHSIAMIHVCPKCEEVLFQKSDLIEHMKNHLLCYYCNRHCPNLKQLNRHIKTHK